MAAAVKDISINTLIGAGSLVRGELNVSGFVRIDGDLDGNLQASGRVIIGENSRIRGDVRGQMVTIGGIVEGNVIAPEGVDILPSGMVLGDVLTKKLTVAESVLLHGYCFAVNDSEKFDKACFAWNNRRAAANSGYETPGNGNSGNRESPF